MKRLLAGNQYRGIAFFLGLDGDCALVELVIVRCEIPVHTLCHVSCGVQDPRVADVGMIDNSQLLFSL